MLGPQFTPQDAILTAQKLRLLLEWPKNTTSHGDENEKDPLCCIRNHPCLRIGGLLCSSAERRARSGMDGKATLFRTWWSRSDTGYGGTRVWSDHERSHRR